MKRLMPAVVVLIVAVSAQAALIEVFDPGDLDQDGTVTWPGSSPFPWTNPFVADVDGAPGLSMLVQVPTVGDASILRREVGTSWISGALPTGLQLIWVDVASGPVTLAFSHAIEGIGFYIESELVANTTFAISAFGEGFSSLGTVSEFRANGDGFFYGVRSDTDFIRTIEITSSFDPDIVLGGLVVQVPEPVSVILLGLGVSAVALTRRVAGAGRG